MTVPAGLTCQDEIDKKVPTSTIHGTLVVVRLVVRRCMPGLLDRMKLRQRGNPQLVVLHRDPPGMEEHREPARQLDAGRVLFVTTFELTMPLRRKPKSKLVAPAVVYFTQARNEDGQRQLCVYGECTYGGSRVGPVWSHSDASVRRVLATLSSKCDCGRRFHKHRFTEGHRVVHRDED